MPIFFELKNFFFYFYESDNKNKIVFEDKILVFIFQYLILNNNYRIIAITIKIVAVPLLN